MKVKTCFLICPIGKDGSETRKRSDIVYEHILKQPLGEKGYDLTRADKIFQADTITDTIIKLLNESDLVIADISEANPNVYYELGYRTALRKPIIQIAKQNTPLPFDISTKRTFFYDETDLNNVDNLKTLLLTIIDNIEYDEKNKPKNSTLFDEEYQKKIIEHIIQNPAKGKELIEMLNTFKDIKKIDNTSKLKPLI